jgi:hypothetical protein
MRGLICGGRDFADADLFDAAMARLDTMFEIDTVIQGGAAGADAMAKTSATAKGKELLSFPADWTLHGRVDGPIRNKQMLDEGKPDVVIAFPGGRGTANMMGQARSAGVNVIDIAAPGMVALLLRAAGSEAPDAASVEFGDAVSALLKVYAWKTSAAAHRR